MYVIQKDLKLYYFVGLLFEGNRNVSRIRRCMEQFGLRV